MSDNYVDISLISCYNGSGLNSRKTVSIFLPCIQNRSYGQYAFDIWLSVLRLRSGEAHSRQPASSVPLSAEIWLESVIEDIWAAVSEGGKLMTITKDLKGNEAVLRVDGRLDTQTSPELLSAIEGLGDTVTSLLLDFSGLEFISSAGLRVVIIASKKMNGALVIKNASARIMSIFTITGIDQKIKLE